MTIFDRSSGYVTLLTDAHYDQSNDSWSASGATVTYLDSNGLHVGTGFSDNPNNTGSHRGNNGATSVARYDMVQAGAITNVLKISSGPEVGERWVFPMIGSDGHYAGSDAGVPPQGLRLRLKPDARPQWLRSRAAGARHREGDPAVRRVHRRLRRHYGAQARRHRSRGPRPAVAFEPQTPCAC